MKNLIGRYKLLSHGIFSSEGTFKPTSPYLKGELIYSSEGFLSVQIFFKNEIEGPRDVLTYSGKYVCTHDCVIEHHIEICSQPKRDQTIEQRNYLLQDDQLTLSVNFEDKSKFEAKWQKIN